jgi:hypothetical protein
MTTIVEEQPKPPLVSPMLESLSASDSDVPTIPVVEGLKDLAIPEELLPKIITQGLCQNNDY